MIREKVREIWSRELKLDDFADEDDFFAVGGHSLTMTRVQQAIAAELGVEIPMDVLFARPTVTNLVAHLEALRTSV